MDSSWARVWYNGTSTLLKQVCDWGRWSLLLELSAEKVRTQVAADVGMKVGHAARLIDALGGKLW